MPATSEEIPRHRLSITTQDFFYAPYWLEEKQKHHAQRGFNPSLYSKYNYRLLAHYFPTDVYTQI
jgi:hypothetical protein